MAEEKTEKVTIGRNVVHDNIMYAKTEPGDFYMVTPRVARALRAKNATASVASHMATERERERQREATEAAAASGAGGGGEDPSKAGVIIGGGSRTGEGGAAGAGGTASQPPDGHPHSDGGAGGSGGGDGIESLTGELPDDFPKRAELAKGAPDADPPIPPVTRYEQLIPLTRAELDSIPGIGEASVDTIGQRLLADAEKASGGGGGQ